jgi:hypothetical protein
VASVLTTPLSTAGLEWIDSLDPYEDEQGHRNMADGDNTSVVSDKSGRIGSRGQHIPIQLGHVLKFCSTILLHERHECHDSPLDDVSANTSRLMPFIPSSFRLFTQCIRRTLQLEHVPPGFLHMKRTFHHIHRVDTTDDDINAVDEAIISMTTWLYANKIISCLKEYLVPIKTMSRRPSSDEVTTISQSQAEQLDQVEVLYKQVMESNFLTSGMISNMALAWRCGWSSSTMKAFRLYVLCHKNFQLVTRSHCEGDDWGSP